MRVLVLSDLHLEFASFRRLRPADQAAWHARTVAWLRSELGADSRPTIVVTHHAPSARSVNPAFEGDPINGAYASDLEGLISEFHPALWIRGHTHYCVDYRLGDTRILSNQRGYPTEPAHGFDPGLVVDVG